MNAAAEQVRQIEIDIDVAKEHIARAEALNRLRKNKDFKKVIIDTFMGSECIRVVKALAEPSCQDPTTQNALRNKLIAVGTLEQYMIAVDRIADQATKALEDYKHELETLEDEEE